MAENIDAERADNLAEFAKWKGYPLPEFNADGNFDKDWLHREWVAFCAGRRRTPSASIGEDGLPEMLEFPRPAVTYADHSYPAFSKRQMAEFATAYAREAVAADRRAREVTIIGYGDPVDNLTPSPQAAQGVKDYEIRELVNTLRDIAVQYHDTEQLRARIHNVVIPVFQRAQLARQSLGVNAADAVSVMLWLYRRLPRAYGRPPHVETPIAAMAKAAGIDVADSFTERDPAPLLSSEPQAREDA